MNGLIFFLAAAVTATQPDIALYQNVLQKYVRDNGKVDYAGLKSGLQPLTEYVRQIAAVSPDSHPELFPTREAKLAYWINAYNAHVLRSFALDYPEKKDRLHGELGRRSFFYKDLHRVGGVERTLDDIEVKSLRKGFHDPRIHMAIVCASTSCPWLSRTAYTVENVDAKLEEDAIRYFAQPRNFAMDPKHRIVTLPKIFEWFKEDFGPDAPKVLEFVAKYRPEEAAQLRSGTWKIRYFDYDWSPNDVR